MFEEKVFGFRLRAERSKVRYGRAVLTVQRSGVVVFTPAATTLREYREGKASADDVAWTWVKGRVVEHSPTFNWAGADIEKLLPRITAVTDDPKIDATTPAELVPELESLAADDLKELDHDRQRFRELNQLWPGFSEMDLSQLMESGVILTREDGPKISDATADWRLIETLIQGLLKSETIADKDSFYRAIEEMLESEPFSRLSTATGISFEATLPDNSWSELESLAKQVEDPTLLAVIRHGMETLGTSEMVSPEATIKELTETIASLQSAVEEMGDSPQKAILLGVMSGLITVLIQAALARFGVRL